MGNRTVAEGSVYPVVVDAFSFWFAIKIPSEAVLDISGRLSPINGICWFESSLFYEEIVIFQYGIQSVNLENLLDSWKDSK